MTLTDSLCLVNKLLLYFNSVSSVKREKVMVMMMMMMIMIIKKLCNENLSHFEELYFYFVWESLKREQTMATSAS